MDFLLRCAEGHLGLEAVDPAVYLVMVCEEYGQAVLGTDACPVKVVEERAVGWYPAIK